MKRLVEVMITETLSKSIIIEVDFNEDADVMEEQALAKVQTAYDEEHIVLDADDFVEKEYQAFVIDPSIEESSMMHIGKNLIYVDKIEDGFIHASDGTVTAIKDIIYEVE